jgi:hypothetical protein
MQLLCSAEQAEFQKENGTHRLEGEDDMISLIDTTTISLRGAATPPPHWNFIPCMSTSPTTY